MEAQGLGSRLSPQWELQQISLLGVKEQNKQPSPPQAPTPHSVCPLMLDRGRPSWLALFVLNAQGATQGPWAELHLHSQTLQGQEESHTSLLSSYTYLVARSHSLSLPTEAWRPEAIFGKATESRMTCQSLTHSRCPAEQRTSCQLKARCVPSPKVTHAPSKT